MSAHNTRRLARRRSLLLIAAIALLTAGTLHAASKLPAPEPLWPRDRMTMTDVASFFRWTPVQGCTDYDVQIARDREFKTLYKEKRTKNARYHEDCYFPKEVLPPGDYWWRVRAVIDGREGPWSPAWAVAVNDDHAAAAALVRPISPEHPIFLMRNRAWDPRAHADHLGDLFPADLSRAIVVDDVHLADATSEQPIERARKYQELGLDFVVWNNRARVPLCQMEYFFQIFSHCIGTAEGEQFGGWGWEKGPEGNFSEEDYLNRAWVLCGKYGRTYFWGEGENSRYLWTTIAKENRPTFARYGRNIVPMFKSTNAYASPHSVGAVKGLMASGYVENCGYWADEWVWPGGGFGKLGEIVEGQEASRALRRKYGTKQCPWVYDLQMWLMGIASGSTAFQLESAHQWTAEGEGAEQYRRFFQPFVSAVVKHRLIPSRQAFLDGIKLAVDCDYEKARQRNGNEKDTNFAFLNRLYGLDQSWYREIIPNDGRYGFVCLLPPGARCLDQRTRVVPQADLLDPTKAAALFDAAYPRRFTGDAFMWECDGTVIVTNTNENRDADQRFQMPLARGPVREIAGTIGVHQYLVGKVAGDGSGFWFQANGEYPDRPIKLELVCPVEPHIAVTPEKAKVAGRWDAAVGRYTLTLSIKDVPVECDLRP